MDEVVEGDFIYGQITNSLSVGGFKNIGSKNMSFSDGKFETVLIKIQRILLSFRELSSLLIDDLSDDMIVFRNLQE